MTDNAKQKSKKRLLYYSFVATLIIVVLITYTALETKKSEDAMKKYEEAIQLIQKDDWENAHKKMKDVVKYPEDVYLFKKYLAAGIYIKGRKWDDAQKVLEDLTQYRDSETLKIFVTANIVYERKTELEIKNGGYEFVEIYLREIPVNYQGDFRFYITEFRNLINEKSKIHNEDRALEATRKREKELGNIAQIIKKGNYAEARKLIGNGSDETSVVLENYLTAIENYKEFSYNRMAKDSLGLIDPNWDGILHEEINNLALKVFGSKEIWIDNYEWLEKPLPEVGMTADQVVNSRWEYPHKINKTTYSWGVQEQWVYNGYRLRLSSGPRYIYLEDGIVTSIQE